MYGKKHKPQNRNYNCPKCNFKYHRDGVGSINIFKKYTIGTLEGKSDWLEGVLNQIYL
ncbi:zinc ribbon domain-containing protein [Halanaerobaculum tunisiense]